MRIRPAARDQLPMPAQDRSRRYEQRSLPRRSRQHPAESRQQRPISLRQLRTGHLTLKHAKLMTEQQDFDLLLPLRTTPQHNQLSSRHNDQYTHDRTTPCERRATGADPTGQAQASPGKPTHRTRFPAPNPAVISLQVYPLRGIVSRCGRSSTRTSSRIGGTESQPMSRSR